MMSQQFKELIMPNDLLSLPKFTAYTKLMVDGVTTDPFSMKTFPLPAPTMSEEIKDKMRKQSRQRYGMEKEKLEQLLKVRAQKQFTEAEKVAEKAQKENLKDDGTTFSIADIKLGDWFEGYVKLKYNYGIFVTVKGVEGLLHKSQVKVPPNLDDWKGIYTIGDKIKVKAQEFKVIDGTKRIVWTQL
jgi:polyribonucleotide nucleotidyltransferase